MSPSTTYLHRIIAEAGGCLPVERFMREALYHPEFGYYAARIGKIGRVGDFSTSATLHPALGWAVGAWIWARAAEARRPGKREWHVIELGGGNGDLAAEVLRGLGWLRRRALTYHMVEISGALQTVQRARLGRLAGRVRWHEDIVTALDEAQGHALIFSNEFVDAFPCAQLTLDAAGQQWQEVCVGWNPEAAAPHESFQPWLPPDEPSASTSSALSAGQPPGQRVECHFSYRRWLESWRDHWQSGRLLTIDYGDTCPGLYQRRPQGTLRAYFRQQRCAGLEIYARFGQQDLTADVNFTDLQTWGEQLRMTTTAFTTQASFLERWLSARQLRTASRDAHLAFLLDPDGAGTAFKVLEQRSAPAVPDPR